MPSWDPTQYTQYDAERARPFADLMARVQARHPRLVVDLGCGDGARTLELATRWPTARVVGIDSSPTMLAQARERDPQSRVSWLQGDLADVDVPATLAAPDVVIAAASLQWVPDHLSVARRWVDALAPGGWFALHVPGNHDAPSHALMRRTAAGHPRAAELLPRLLGRESVAGPSGYVEALWAPGRTVEAWETTYLHLLDPEGASPDPVLEWVRGTGLRPVLDTLTEESDREQFLTPYRAALRQAYPRTPAGVPLAFRRVFCVVRVT